MATLIFNNKVLQVVEKNNQIWISASDLANALNYKRSDYVTRIYNRNSDEFTCNMTETVKLTLSGNLSKTVRFFSLRGAHLIAMFANTDVAKMFRKWVLDILDKKSNEQKNNPTTVLIPYEGRWVVKYMDNKAEIKNIDNKVCLDNDLFVKLQKDSVFYRKQVDELARKLQGFLALTENYAQRTRITSSECSVTVLDHPLSQLIY